MNQISSWGPAKHDPEHPLHRSSADALQLVMGRRDLRAGLDLRDEDDLRPDDN